MAEKVETGVNIIKSLKKLETGDLKKHDEYILSTRSDKGF